VAGTDETTGSGRSPAPDLVVLGRYRLVDKVGDSAGTALWRGQDDRLRRPVSVRFARLDDPHADALRKAALQASHVTDRRAVHVLDAVADTETGCQVIVTEWLAGTSYAEQLANREPRSPHEAAALALEVARTLEAAREVGVTHGNLRPELVMITDTGDVRIRGLGVEQVLHGVEPGDDPELADVHAVGAILFAGLTGRWPGPTGVDGLPGVPLLKGGRTPWPGRVVADVPRDLDEIAARALRTTDVPKPAGHFTSLGEVVSALTASLATPTAPVVPVASVTDELRPRRRRTPIRVASVIVAVACAVGLAYLGLQMVLGLGGSPLTVPRAAGQPQPSATSGSALPSASGGEQVLPIVSATDFDPFGNNKQENPQLVPLAIDNNPATAWTTVHYKAADMSGKGGVGLLLDLGAPRPVSAVTLRLVGNGTDLAILATDDPTKKVTTFTSMAEVTGAGSTLTLRVPRPVTTRYLVVWLTNLPSADGSYQGGIVDVRVLG
jgi:hypothetical protein